MKPKTLKQYVEKCHKYPWFEMSEIYNKYKSNIERVGRGEKPVFRESFPLENTIEQQAIDRFFFLKMFRERLLIKKSPKDGAEGK